ncbi:hypothetical protein ACQ4PT_024366 [Festuca glaucescens]
MSRGDLLHRMEEGIRNRVPAAGNRDNDAYLIVRLPPHVREMNRRSLYEPVMVAIGPHHLSSQSTRTMQLHKWRLLNEFLLRGRACILLACIEVVRATEHRARSFYGETLGVESDDFVEMMVLDGCFILEYLLKWSENNGGFTHRTSLCVYYDLLLVENQMPFFVLRQLFSLRIATTDMVDQRLLDLIFRFFSLLDPPGQLRCAGPPTPVGAVYHLLHLHYQRIVMTPEQRRPHQLTRLGASSSSNSAGITSSIRARMTGTTTAPFAIPCVTKLQECGVTFREKESPASQFDATFRSGTMEIPRLVINGGTTTLLANLFALEQTQDCNECTVTGYLLLMNALVHTSADVAVLRRRGVLDNLLSNDDEVATFFNQLGGVALFDHRVHQFARLFRDTNEYCNCRWNRYMAVFKRDHLQSPCSIIKLVVASILLCASVMSVCYIICRYHHACS